MMDSIVGSPLSVVRIRPDDQLNLRQTPSVRATSVALLPFRFEGMRATGHACSVDNALWVEIESSVGRGWVNQYYAQPSSSFRRVERVGATPSEQLRAATLPGLAALLRQDLASFSGIGPSGKSEVELVGFVERGKKGQIVLFDANGGDDSISGQEFVVGVALATEGWRVQQIEVRATCWRGVSEGFCR